MFPSFLAFLSFFLLHFSFFCRVFGLSSSASPLSFLPPPPSLPPSSPSLLPLPPSLPPCTYPTDTIRPVFLGVLPSPLPLRVLLFTQLYALVCPVRGPCVLTSPAVDALFVTLTQRLFRYVAIVRREATTGSGGGHAEAAAAEKEEEVRNNLCNHRSSKQEASKTGELRDLEEFSASFRAELVVFRCFFEEQKSVGDPHTGEAREAPAALLRLLFGVLLNRVERHRCPPSCASASSSIYPVRPRQCSCVWDDDPTAFSVPSLPLRVCVCV